MPRALRTGTGGGRVLGVDACRRGWIAVAADDAVTRAYFAADIQMLVAQAQCEDLTLVTRDENCQKYGVSVLVA